MFMTLARFEYRLNELPVGLLTEVGLDGSCVLERALAALGDERHRPQPRPRDERLERGGLAGFLRLSRYRHVANRDRYRLTGPNLETQDDFFLVH